MNEPKFRAYLKSINKVLPVCELSFRDNDDLPIGVDGCEMWYRTDEVILMQSTGLKDKNGVEIFEGDVVKQTTGEYSYVGAVEKDCYQFYIDGINPFDSYSFDDVADTNNCTADLIIIGNIHANPELLEVEK
ncbi:YopX family protein [Enterococcus sp. AZ126]|uniref:YopX family protein n=1 Tax=Enterococcus sp. AZ126 TaxID=2774635 RepID=UPI003F2478EC